jgi:predicted P-loop ATPase
VYVSQVTVDVTDEMTPDYLGASNDTTQALFAVGGVALVCRQLDHHQSASQHTN